MTDHSRGSRLARASRVVALSVAVQAPVAIPSAGDSRSTPAPAPSIAGRPVLTDTEPAPRTLGSPIARYDGDYSFISGVRELADGRVLLTDFKEPAIYLVAPRGGARTKIGSAGRGPNEYLMPGGIYAGFGDTLLVLDRGQPRVVVVDGRGRVVGDRSIELRGTSGSSDEDVDLQRVDRLARAYFRGHADFRKRLASNGAMVVDSVPLLRLTPSSQRLDTMTVLHGPAQRAVATGPNTMQSQAVHFSPVDDWGVSADGRVAVVRAANYRVEWILPDRTVIAGPPIAIDQLRVTEQDRADIAERFGRGRPALSMGAQGRGEAIRQPAAPVAPLEATYAQVKPPFGLGDVFVSSDARVYVRRHRAARSVEVLYDVFDDRGRRVDRFLLPARSRIVGTSPGAIFVATLDTDDLPHLAKYKL